MAGNYSSRAVVNNVDRNKLVAALSDNDIPFNFSYSNIELADNIDKLLVDGKIELATVNNIYNSQIFFSKHKCCYLSEFDALSVRQLEMGILNIEQEYNIKEPFCDFVTIRKGNEKIVALKKVYADKTLDSIEIVFQTQIETSLQGIRHTKNVFIPIIIQIPQNRVTVMVDPTIEGTKEKGHRHSCLAKEYLEKIKKFFNLSWTESKNKFAGHSHNLTRRFINDAYQTALGNMDNTVEEQFESVVASSSDIIVDFLKNTLKVVSLEEKSQQSVSLDISESVKTIIENAAISNYILDNKKGISKTSQTGYITSLKFQDRVKSQAKMNGDGYVKPIMDSDTFLSLRGDLKKFREISSLRLKWMMGDKKLDVRYEIENMTTLIIRFYHIFDGSDYINATQKYEEFGQANAGQI